MSPFRVFPPVTTLRIAALLMPVAVFATFVSPFGFIAIGAVAGVVMVAQLAFLAQAETQRGIAMGLWSTRGYAGMTLLPFVAGVVAEQTHVLLRIRFFRFPRGRGHPHDRALFLPVRREAPGR